MFKIPILGILFSNSIIAHFILIFEAYYEEDIYKKPSFAYH